MVTETEVIHGLMYGHGQHPLTKAALATAAAEYRICQQQRLTLSSRYGGIPQGDQSTTWWQVDYIEPLHPWSGQQFVFTGVEMFSGYRFAFPAYNASSKISPF